MHLKKPVGELLLLLFLFWEGVGSAGSFAFTRMSRRDLGRRKDVRGGSGKAVCSSGDACRVWRCEWMILGICDVALLYVMVNVGRCDLVRLRYVRRSDLGFSFARVMASSTILGS